MTTMKIIFKIFARIIVFKLLEQKYSQQAIAQFQY
jgi:hypothetical protein